MFFTNKYTAVKPSKQIYFMDWKKIDPHKRYSIWMEKMENGVHEWINKIENINQRLRLLKKIDFIKRVYRYLADNPERTTQEALRAVAISSNQSAIKKVSISRTRFFNMQHIIFTTLVSNLPLSRKEERCFHKLCPRSTAPKNPNEKYSNQLKRCIAAYYDEQMDDSGINITDLTLQLRCKKIILLRGSENLENICEQTVRRCLEKYSRCFKKNLRDNNPYMFRLKPYLLTKLGRVQLDVKYLTPRFTGLKRTLYWIDMKDEASKVIYAEVSTTQTAASINQMIINGINYFREKFGIRIIRIQTDHCNSFRQVKIAKDRGFQDILHKYGIAHRYSIINHPQTNGTIERHHLTVTNELRVAIKLAGKDGLIGIQKLCVRYLQRFNFNRYHTYTYRVHSKMIREYDIPFERLQKLKILKINDNLLN